MRGLVFGAIREASQPVHELVSSPAISHGTVAVALRGRMGLVRSVALERAIKIGQVQRQLLVAKIRAQCLSLNCRLELIGTGMPKVILTQLTTH